MAKTTIVGKTWKCQNIYLQRFKTPEERFWEKVIIPKQKDDCWEWAAGKDGEGYAVFHSKTMTGKRAARFVWMIRNGNIPDGKIVCHHCDNPACVNPSHLFLGTSKDNSDDMISKGRNISCPGEKNGMVTLTDQQVSEIRQRCANGEVQRRIAEDFNVGFRAINKIVHRQRWKHVK